MFTEKSFQVFDIEGLEPRMEAIRAEIQPVFSEIGEILRGQLAEALPEMDFYLHIAQHRRRTAYAPDSTWSAISTQKRGYKMEACWTLGIWKDHVFLYLSMIDQPKAKEAYAELLSKTAIKGDFAISKDHTQNTVFGMEELAVALERFQKVKKSEFEIGRIWPAATFVEKPADELLQEMQATLTDLLPIYKKLLEV
ncbi:DUF1054 family protein [Lactococcus termiticola]|uniref:Uncharacterized protein n=1 Tax=Lactococcus termiticola TaxID=2169526 RepID=A0A2R5HDQ3_9LACT|nr:DUF1054 family protein [Lactococcus termiticola]GBG96214.1 hypothetical protein NtB2_00325 [Lactococcus termiticola]